MLLKFLHVPGIAWDYKVDGSALSSKSACSSDSVQVILLLLRQLIVDDQTYLLYIDTSSQQVSCDEYSG